MKKIKHYTLKKKALFFILAIVSLTSYSQSNQTSSGTQGGYTGEYQWFIAYSEHNWVQKIYGESGNVWKDKFVLTYKIETVSFPFIPNFVKTNDAKRVLGLPLNNEYFSNKNAWAPYGTEPKLYREREFSANNPIGRPVTGDGIPASISVNLPSSLMSNFFEKGLNGAITDFNFILNHRDYYPHTILKHTLYICDINTGEKIDSLSFLRDNTRTHNKFPWQEDGVNNYGDWNRDIAFFSSLEIPEKYSECFTQCANPTIYTDPLFSELRRDNTGNEKVLYPSINTIQHFPFDGSKSKSYNGVLFCPTDYNSTNQYSQNLDYIHPAPFSLYLHHNNQDYTSIIPPFQDKYTNNFDEHTVGIPHTYEIDQNIDLTIINPSEKIIYNPYYANITATNLVFPSGYQFRTYHGYSNRRMEFITESNYNAANPNRFYSNIKDVPVMGHLGANSSKYYIKSGATLIIEPCVELYDVEIIVESGGTLKYSYSDTYGRYLVVYAGGTIVTNYLNYQECFTCKLSFDKEEVEYVNGDWATDYPNKIYKKLTVKAGSELRLVNQTLEMGKDAKIIVEVGASLILDNSKITSTCKWDGIEVQGDPNLPFLDGSATNRTILQGMVTLSNGSTIENAKIGIKAINGGMIYAEGSTFINNEIGIEVVDRIDARVDVALCSFVTNSSFVYDNGSEKDMVAFVKLVNAQAFLKGNTFINSNTHYTNGENYGIGILSYNSTVKVAEHTKVSYGTPGSYHKVVSLADTKSRFENLYKGIDHYSFGGLTTRLVAQNTDFINIGKGITSNNSRYDEIIFNYFELDPTKITSLSKSTGTYGVYSLNSNSHLVAENNIIGKYNSGAGVVNRKTGSFFNTIPTTPLGLTGKISNNEISNTAVSTQSEGFNPLTVYECNNFETNNKVGFRLMDAKSISPFGVHNTQGLQGDIGACVNGETAENIFNSCTPTTDQIVNLSTSTGYVGFKYSDKVALLPDATCTASNVTLAPCFPSIIPNGCKSLTNPSRSLLPKVALVNNGNGQSLKEQGGLKDDLMRMYFRTDQILKAEEFLKNETALEARSMGIAHALDKGDVVDVQNLLTNYPSSTVEDAKFKEFAQVLLDVKASGRKLKDMTTVELATMEGLANSNTKIKVAAEGVLAMVNNKPLIRTPEDTTTTGSIGGGSISVPIIYQLGITPNPAHNVMDVNYDIADKTKGEILIQDAITGLVVKTVQLSSTSGTQTINIATLVQGNYIVVLQGDAIYLKSEHLLVY